MIPKSISNCVYYQTIIGKEKLSAQRRKQQISMLLAHHTFSYGMFLNYCLSSMLSFPSSKAPIILDICSTTQSTSLLVPLFLLFFSISTLYLLILGFSNSAFQCSSSYFSSDLPILWPFCWILISATSFQVVPFHFFFQIWIFSCIITGTLPEVLPLLTRLWGGYTRIPNWGGYAWLSCNIFQAILVSRAF